MPRVATVHGIERKDGLKRFGISIPRAGRSARRVFFGSKAERDRELRRALKVAAVSGSDALSLSAGDVQLLREIREMLPGEVDPREAIRFYLAHNKPIESRLLRDAAREYQHSLELRKLSRDHLGHVERALKRLAAVFGDSVDVSEIGARDMLEFFSGLPFMPRTLANYQQYCGSFFKWLVKAGYLSRSPMASIEKISIPEKEPEFLAVDDVARMFEVCQLTRPEAAPFLALSFFAGFRSSQLSRIRREDIRFNERGILLPGATHKTKRRFYVDGFPDNLWAWLEPLRDVDELRRLPTSTFTQWRERIYLRAGVDYPQNGGRHSFCTYHVALFGDAGKTATLLTHRGSVSMLYNHYRGNSSKAEAQRYFDILPEV